MKSLHVALLSGGLGLAIGLTAGVGIGILSTEAGKKAFDSLVSIEHAPDLKHPVELSRPTFRLKYPGNWKVAADEATYDPDHLFSLRSPGGGLRVVVSLPTAPIEAQKSMTLHRDDLVRSVLKGATETPFARWGAYDGAGLLLKGRLLGLIAGHARIFAYADSTRSFTVVEVVGNDSENPQETASALRLIEDSFALK